MGADLVRNSLRLALATFVTAAIALWFERLMFLWYPLIAVVVTLDDSDDQTLHAAVARMLGTILGGMVTFVVHTVVDGWIGVLVSLLLMLPLLRLLGWQEAIGTATLISLMFLMNKMNEFLCFRTWDKCSRGCSKFVSHNFYQSNYMLYRDSGK